MISRVGAPRQAVRLYGQRTPDPVRHRDVLPASVHRDVLRPDPQRDPQLGPQVGVVQRAAEQLLDPAHPVAQGVPVHAEVGGGGVPLAVVGQPGARARRPGRPCAPPAGPAGSRRGRGRRPGRARRAARRPPAGRTRTARDRARSPSPAAPRAPRARARRRSTARCRRHGPSARSAAVARDHDGRRRAPRPPARRPARRRRAGRCRRRRDPAGPAARCTAVPPATSTTYGTVRQPRPAQLFQRQAVRLGTGQQQRHRGAADPGQPRLAARPLLLGDVARAATPRPRPPTGPAGPAAPACRRPGSRARGRWRPAGAG